MKKYDLTITIRIEVESPFGLFDTVRELEIKTVYSIGSTENVKVLDTEILKSHLPDT